jgi:hypothetical protein
MRLTNAKILRNCRSLPRACAQPVAQAVAQPVAQPVAQQPQPQQGLFHAAGDIVAAPEQRCEQQQ